MKNNKKGFTLAELLIVIAIMAILIAIAIPVFSSQLENARHSVDQSTERSALSLAESHFLLCHAAEAPATGITCEFGTDGKNNLGIKKCTVGSADCTKLDSTLATTFSTDCTSKCQCTDTSNGGVGSGKKLSVTVSKDGVVSATWATSAP